jgi:hypothetical protein
MRISMAGGGTNIPPTTIIPEKDASYPEAKMFGPQVPASGFWVRHARAVDFINVRISLNKPDARPLIASGGDTEELTLDGKPMSPFGVSSANK